MGSAGQSRAMDRRTLATPGLAVAGVSQASYGVLLGGADPFALIAFGEGAGLLLAAVGVWRARRLPGTWVVAGLTLAAVMALPWFTRVGAFRGPGPVASVLNNTGSVVAAVAVLAWTLAATAPTLAWKGLRLGLGLQALGSLLWLAGNAGRDIGWTLAFALAFLGFAGATATFPEPSPEVPTTAAPRTSPAAGKTP